MEFNAFIEKLSFELKNELPGFLAQNPMAPMGRRPTEEYFKTDISPKNSAVLILLYPDAANSTTNVVLIVRAESEKGSHGGQISFPGGGFDASDVHLSATALRETEEEIGVDRNSIRIIGELSPLYIPVSNYLVHPFVGISDNAPEFKKHALEVSDLLEVEMNEFLSERNRTTSNIYIKARNIRFDAPCYNIKGKIIWGATAMILAEFVEVIRKIK